MNSFAENKFKELTIEAVKITADGKRIPLGVVSYWSRNPIKRFAFWLKQKLGY
jgi:hypothetical protein